MGIDIYVNEIHSAHREKIDPQFKEACTKRDGLKDKYGSKAYEAAQAKVMKFYDEMYAVGYLRESYHGGPYVTRFLVKEAFEAEDCEAPIPAAWLRERLPYAVLMAVYRNHVVYEQGRDPGVITIKSDGDTLVKAMANIFAGMPAVKEGNDEKTMAAAMTEEQLKGARDLIAKNKVPRCAKQFVEFVEQCEAREAETGRPVVVSASY